MFYGNKYFSKLHSKLTESAITYFYRMTQLWMLYNNHTLFYMSFITWGDTFFRYVSKNVFLQVLYSLWWEGFFMCAHFSKLLTSNALNHNRPSGYQWKPDNPTPQAGCLVWAPGDYFKHLCRTPVTNAMSCCT